MVQEDGYTGVWVENYLPAKMGRDGDSSHMKHGQKVSFQNQKGDT